MNEKTFDTEFGTIRYWISEKFDPDRLTLVFLPGLTADHRLFYKQVEYFEGKENILMWDAPGHYLSRPFDLSFTLFDKANWLKDIMVRENIVNPVIVGQSMGGYLGQAFMEKYPGRVNGFISIDSAPLQRRYMSAFEIWLMKNVEPVYKWYPWKALVRDGAKGTAYTEDGQNLMKEMMESYSSSEYAHLVGHGYRMLAMAVEADLPYEITCPVLLICGEKDSAGETKIYNKKWANKTGFQIKWIPNAGHNSNTDNPELINSIIDKFVKNLY